MVLAGSFEALCESMAMRLAGSGSPHLLVISILISIFVPILVPIPVPIPVPVSVPTFSVAQLGAL